MHNIIIIHGSYGNPYENWFPWLKNKLEILGHNVIVPQFPIPSASEIDEAYSGHDLDKWFDTLAKYNQYINGDTIFVSHSRGSVFAYHVLAKIKDPVHATFLVAPWINYIWYPKGWTKVDSFHQIPFDWEKIKGGSKYFEIYQSNNDDIPVHEGKEISRLLNGKLVVIENAGHFNTKAGYTEFPLLLENLKRVL